MLNGDGVSVWEGKTVLKVDSGNCCPTMCIYLMPLNCALQMVKMAHFRLCMFPHNKKKCFNEKPLFTLISWQYAQIALSQFFGRAGLRPIFTVEGAGLRGGGETRHAHGPKP